MKKHFNSNETLEMCDVRVSQDGRVEIQTKSYHGAELERLGCPPNPTGAIRGRMTRVDQNLVFAPYAEQSRKPTFSDQVIVGSTSLQRTIDKVKVSFSVPCHLSKDIFILYVQSEIDEVKRRLALDVYDRLAKTHPTPPCEGGDSDSAEPQKGGAV